MAKEYTILFDSKQCQLSPTNIGLPMDFIQAELSHEYDRKIMPDFETKIEELWNAKLRETPSMFNATKFRLHDLTVTEESVRLKFGLTCYKDFQCTNMQPNFRKLLEDYAVEHFGDDARYACMANPMYNIVLVETIDKCIILFKRSNMVGESPGLFDLPGGHLEPSEVDACESLEDMDPKDVVYELYYSAFREVRDEVNLPESSLSWPSLLMIMRNNSIGGKPGAGFHMKCSCSSEEIKDYYKKGGPESYESTEVFLIKTKDLFEENSPMLEELRKNLTVSAGAVLDHYKLYYIQEA